MALVAQRATAFPPTRKKRKLADGRGHSAVSVEASPEGYTDGSCGDSDTELEWKSDDSDAEEEGIAPEAAKVAQQLQASPGVAAEAGNGRRNTSNTCTTCGRSFTKHARLVRHVRSHTGERPYVCDHPGCGLSYARKDKLVRHMATHQTERRFKCSFSGCDKGFYEPSHLKRHEVIHTKVRPTPYVCDFPQLSDAATAAADGAVGAGGEGSSSAATGGKRAAPAPCGAAFTHKTKLRQHVMEVHGAKTLATYKCEQPGCGKAYVSRSKLQAHEATHMRRYICGATATGTGTSSSGRSGDNEAVCGAVFTTAADLRAHGLAAHPPRCEECSTTFPSKKALTKHNAVEHALPKGKGKAAAAAAGGEAADPESGNSDSAEPKPAGYICGIDGCPRAYTERRNLLAHQRAVHERPRRFPCGHPGCDKAFGYQHVRRNHELKVHGAEAAAAAAAAPVAAAAEEEAAVAGGAVEFDRALDDVNGGGGDGSERDGSGTREDGCKALEEKV